MQPKESLDVVNTWGTIPAGATHLQVRQIILILAAFAWVAITCIFTGTSSIFAFSLNAAFLILLMAISLATRTVSVMTILTFVFSGGSLMGLAYIIEKNVTAGLGQDSLFVNVPLEEVLKLIPVLLYLWIGRKFTDWTLSATDLFIIGAASGGGFAFVQASFVHATTGWQNQLIWLPSTEVVNGCMIAGPAIWTSLAAGTIGLALTWRHRRKAALILAVVGTLAAIVDHFASDYALERADWVAGMLKFVSGNGYVEIVLFLAAFAAAIFLDRFALFRTLPKMNEFRIPSHKDAGTLGKFWDFVVDRRRLAFSYYRFERATGAAKAEAGIVVAILMQHLINCHRKLASPLQVEAAPAKPHQAQDLTLFDFSSPAHVAQAPAFAGPKVDGLFVDLPEQYSVSSVISEGGMGVIYAVKHKLTGAQRAIKVLHPHLARLEQNVRRFNVEASAASALAHPNLVVVHDFGFTPNNVPFLVMDLIEGTSLQDELKMSGPMAIPRFLTIFLQATDALAHAHKRGVIHRDLKPSNMILAITDNGQDSIRIVDFGIAKMTNESGLQTQELTKSGDLVGSPMYMSPEQCLGTPLDSRSDIYSLGCVMYEVITGQPPFLGGNAVQTIFKHLNEMPAQPSTLRSDLAIPHPLEGILFRTLQKQPEARFESMDALNSELTQFKTWYSQKTIT